MINNTLQKQNIDNNINNLSNKIVIFIYLPLILHIFYIEQLSINTAYLVVLVQSLIFLLSIRDIKIKVNGNQIMLLLLVFLLFIIAVFSSLTSNFQKDSLKAAILVFSTSLFLLILVLSDKKPYITFNKIVKTQVIIGVFLSIIAIVIFAFGDFTLIEGRATQAIIIGPIKIYQIVMGQSPYYRVTSLTTNPNTLGIILMLSQIGIIYLRQMILVSKNRFLLLYLIQVMALILTQSRGAIVTALIMIITFMIFSSNNQKNKIKICIITVLFVVIAYVVVINNSYINVLLRFQGGLNSRNLSWGVLINEVIKNPLTGLGFGVSNDMLLSDGIEIKAHNVFINSMAEIGLIGFFTFISIWILGLIKSYIGIKSNKENIKAKKTYALIFTVLFSLIFHQMIENKLLVYDYVMFTWIYLVSCSILQINVDE